MPKTQVQLVEVAFAFLPILPIDDMSITNIDSQIAMLHEFNVRALILLPVDDEKFPSTFVTSVHTRFGFNLITRH